MSQLTTLQCERCGLEFTMATQKLDDTTDVACPMCERNVRVPDPDSPDDEIEDSDDDEDEA
ncbi:MAG: hypothetical protein HQ478_11025 [Chloroflexi bacterium]|nr:hypothetical protein [Chloroflexota bacterium]